MTPLLANISIAEKMFELGYANKITLGDFEPVYTSSNALERNLNRANVLWLKNNSRFLSSHILLLHQVIEHHQVLRFSTICF